jgi:hypothetical protein
MMNRFAALLGFGSWLPVLTIRRRADAARTTRQIRDVSGRCVVFLAADDAGLITGSTLTANGAQYIT